MNKNLLVNFSLLCKLSYKNKLEINKIYYNRPLENNIKVLYQFKNIPKLYSCDLDSQMYFCNYNNNLIFSFRGRNLI